MSYDFWNNYLANYAAYDKYFMRKYRSWVPFWYEDQTGSEMLAEWLEEVTSFLMLHEKRYSELYRIHVVSDTDDPLTYNYDMTETMDRTTNKGEQIDSAAMGARNDTQTIGEKTDSGSVVHGTQSSTNTDQVSPEDDESYYNRSKQSATMDTYTDTSSTTLGSQSNSSTVGAQTNTNTSGAREDSEEYTLTRRGNIGVQTAGDMLRIHRNFWDAWRFYDLIFSEIVKDLCVLGGIGEC